MDVVLVMSTILIMSTILNGCQFCVVHVFCIHHVCLLVSQNVLGDQHLFSNCTIHLCALDTLESGYGNHNDSHFGHHIDNVI